MKHFAQWNRRGDRFFHMPPGSAMFSLIATFVFAVVAMLVLFVVSAK